jgi:hypothetical protein
LVPIFVQQKKIDMEEEKLLNNRIFFLLGGSTNIKVKSENHEETLQYLTMMIKLLK